MLTLKKEEKYASALLSLEVFCWYNIWNFVENRQFIPFKIADFAKVTECKVYVEILKGLRQ